MECALSNSRAPGSKPPERNPLSVRTGENGEAIGQDPNLPEGALNSDPRRDGKARKGKAQKKAGNGRNTESFDPSSTLVRPEMRVYVVSRKQGLTRPIKHDDVVIVPDFFCAEDDWTMYYKLVQEMKDSQERGDRQAEWLSWHEGAHLISKNTSGSPTFEKIQRELCEFFAIPRQNTGTRFNWKPFHHDSAAFNAKRVERQNCTVGVSFGETRELAFLHAQSGHRLYFPQTNGMLFFFGRDVNIRFKHGINALPQSEHNGKGRISIVLWGNCTKCVEEEGSPPMLTNESRKGGYDGRTVSRRGAEGRGGGGGHLFHRDHHERNRRHYADRERREVQRDHHDYRGRQIDREGDRNRRSEPIRHERRGRSRSWDDRRSRRSRSRGYNDLPRDRPRHAW